MKTYLDKSTAIISWPRTMIFNPLTRIIFFSGKLKVINRVITPVVIYVMNNLMRLKLATKMLFHNISMLSSIILLGHSNPPITILHKETMSNLTLGANWHSQSPAPLRAKHPTTFVKMAALNLIFGATLKAGYDVVKTALLTWYFPNNPMSIHNIMIHERTA